MPELQQLNPDAYRLLRRLHDEPWDEGGWLEGNADRVGEDV